MDEGTEDTESVLAAYRERKRKAMQQKGEAAAPAPQAPAAAPFTFNPSPGPAAGAPPPGPNHTPATSPAAAPPGPQPPAAAPPAPPRSMWRPPEGNVPAPAAPAARPPTAVPPPAPAAPAANPGPAQPRPAAPPVPTAPAPTDSSLALRDAGPGGLTSAPGSTLSPLGPVLRLSDALLKDHRVSLRGSPKARTIGVTLLLIGLLALALDRRQALAGAPIDGLAAAGVLLFVAGGATAVIGLFLPRNRRLAVRLAASQQEEWRRIQGDTRRLQWQARIGLVLAIAGLALVAAAYELASSALLLLGGALAALGIPALIVAQVQRAMARRLYVQTLVLSGLEASGLGNASDERVQPVILALDQLLGALPEAEVQRFLASPQARAYLELVDEAQRSQRGP